MARAHLQDALNTHLKRIGSDLESFLKAGLDRGSSPQALADELRRLTDIEVHPRTIYRWIDALELEAKEAS